MTSTYKSPTGMHQLDETNKESELLCRWRVIAAASSDVDALRLLADSAEPRLPPPAPSVLVLPAIAPLVLLALRLIWLVVIVTARVSRSSLRTPAAASPPVILSYVSKYGAHKQLGSYTAASPHW